MRFQKALYDFEKATHGEEGLTEQQLPQEEPGWVVHLVNSKSVKEAKVS